MNNKLISQDNNGIILIENDITVVHETYKGFEISIKLNPDRFNPLKFQYDIWEDNNLFITTRFAISEDKALLNAKQLIDMITF